MISLRCHTGNEASGRNKIVQGSIDFRSMCGTTGLCMHYYNGCLLALCFGLCLVSHNDCLRLLRPLIPPCSHLCYGNVVYHFQDLTFVLLSRLLYRPISWFNRLVASFLLAWAQQPPRYGTSMDNVEQGWSIRLYNVKYCMLLVTIFQSHCLLPDNACVLCVLV